MTDLFQDKYRISSIRLSHWDYGSNAAYYITICTKNRVPYFGKVKDGIIQLSAIGQIAHQCWADIPLHFPFVILDEYIIMPDHMHGIIIINKENNIGQQHAVNTFGPQSQNLASIIRGFKVGVTKGARIINGGFGWQPRYYEHIIRNENAHNRIVNYIKNNPKNWRKNK